MSKLLEKSQKSKLESHLIENLDKPLDLKEKAVRKIKLGDHPRSYRLDIETMDILKNTLFRINEVSPKKINETKLIKALIFLSKTLDERKILKALKEVW